MSLLNGLLKGIASTLTVSSPPLYRYPFRNAMEGFRSDWKHISADVEAAVQIFEGNKDSSENEQS